MTSICTKTLAVQLSLARLKPRKWPCLKPRTTTARVKRQTANPIHYFGGGKMLAVVGKADKILKVEKTITSKQIIL
jgi:hypothetical protein